VEVLFQVNGDQPMRGCMHWTGLFVSTPQGRAEPSSRSEAQFSNAVGQGRLKLQVGEPLKASAKVSRYSSGNVDVEVESSKGGLMVMDNNYPGWAAQVNGETRPIRDIYPACRAVAVPPGKHRFAL
jgi:hypothetical protein